MPSRIDPIIMITGIIPVPEPASSSMSVCLILSDILFWFLTRSPLFLGLPQYLLCQSVHGADMNQMAKTRDIIIISRQNHQ